MREDPLRHVLALLSRLHIVKTEVDALPDAHVHYVMGQIREAVIVECLHWRQVEGADWRTARWNTARWRLIGWQ